MVALQPSVSVDAHIIADPIFTAVIHPSLSTSAISGDPEEYLHSRLF